MYLNLNESYKYMNFILNNCNLIDRVTSYSLWQKLVGFFLPLCDPIDNPINSLLKNRNCPCYLKNSWHSLVVQKYLINQMHEIFMNNNKLYYYFVKIKPICSTELNDIIFDIEELLLYKTTLIQIEIIITAKMHVVIFSIIYDHAN